jgi:hypothetical protein
MYANRYRIALVESLLLLPAALFMISLMLRRLPASGLSMAAQDTVMWYAERPWTLWLLLLTLPFGVFVLGCTTLLQDCGAVGHRVLVEKSLSAFPINRASVFIAALTLVAAIILLIVGLHMLAN